MLKSIKDVSIKRYLSTVGECIYKSKEFNSIYYRIIYSDNLKVKIRFSDHFKDEENTFLEEEYVSYIDIVKTSLNFYTIKDLESNFSITVLEQDILTYLKSFLLLYPEIARNISSFKNAYTEIHKKRNILLSQVHKLQSKAEKDAEMTQLVDSVWDENKKLKKENDLLKCHNNDILTECSKIKKENRSLKDTVIKQRNVIANSRTLINNFMNTMTSNCTKYLNETKDYK